MSFLVEPVFVVDVCLGCLRKAERSAVLRELNTTMYRLFSHNSDLITDYVLRKSAIV